MVLKFFLQVFLFCTCFLIHAQTNKEDKKIQPLLDSAYINSVQGNLAKSIRFANSAIYESKKYHNDRGLAYANFYLGQALLESGNYDKALLYLRKSETNKHTKNNYFLQYEIHRVRGRALSGMSLIDEAIKEQTKGLNLINKIDRKTEDKLYLTSMAYQNLSVFHRVSNNEDSCFYYISKNREILESQNENQIYPNLINLYSELGIYYNNQKDYNKSEKFFKKSSDLANKYDYPYKAFNLLRWGNMELDKNNPDEALKHYNEALAYSNATKRLTERSDIYEKMSFAYQKKGNQNLENKYKLLSLELQNEIKNSQLKSNEEILKLLVNNKTEEQKLSYRAIIITIIGSAVFIFLLTYYLFKNKFNRTVAYFKNKIAFKKHKIELLEQQHLKERAQLLEIAKSGDRDFWIKFQQVYPHFKDRLMEVNPKLTTSELTLAAYIVLQFNTREIADMTFRAYKTVETTRYNLRKKLNLSAEIKIDEYLKDFLTQQSKPSDT